MIQFRALTEQDIPLAMRLKRQAGWNQTEADWRRFRALAASGCFVAEWDGEPAGSVVAVEFGPVAWISMVLVDPAFRGRGIGTALMRHALDFLDRRGTQATRLDATPLGEPIYRKLGFESQFEVIRFKRDGPGKPAASRTSTDIATATAAGLEPICKLDQAVTQTDRAPLLRRLAEEHAGHMLVLCQQNNLQGYITARAGEYATQIGPAIAETPEVGCALLAAMLEKVGDSPVFIDVPTDQRAVTQWLVSQGFAEQRRFKRMTRGQRVVEDVSRLIVSSGPEKG